MIVCTDCASKSFSTLDADECNQLMFPVYSFAQLNFTLYFELIIKRSFFRPNFFIDQCGFQSGVIKGNDGSNCQ